MIRVLDSLKDAKLVDLSSASADYKLQVGEVAVINYSASTSVPLRVSTDDNAVYEIELAGDRTVTPSSSDKGGLQPNGTTYTGAFAIYSLWITDTDAAGGSILSTSDAINKFSLFEGRADRISIRAATGLKSKTVVGSVLFTTNVKAGRFSRDIIWKDTTTAWASLGSMSFPFAQSGKIIIRRVA